MREERHAAASKQAARGGAGSSKCQASLEEIRKWSAEEKAVWQREREAMQQQVNRLQEEVLAAASDAAAIVQGMLTHSEHADVQQQACETLRSLACDGCSRIAEPRM